MIHYVSFDKYFFNVFITILCLKKKECINYGVKLKTNNQVVWS